MSGETVGSACALGLLDCGAVIAQVLAISGGIAVRIASNMDISHSIRTDEFENFPARLAASVVGTFVAAGIGR